MVSMTMRSAPAAVPRSTISQNSLQALAKGRLPRGSSSSPRGPMSRATRASVPSAARLARAMAGPMTCAGSYPARASFRALAPKVLA